MAIAEHNPSAVSKKNRGVLRMSHQQLHDFAATKRKRLPEHKGPRKANVKNFTTESHSYNFKQHRGGRKKSRG
jgi:hypothetical protein